jgi:multidrug efflux pump subunit AcrB
VNPATYSLRNRAVVIILVLMVAVGGLVSYSSLGKLEDPEFTIKVAMIYTQYPGATAEEVEREVTEPLETALQQLKQLDKVESISRAGLSIIQAEIQDHYDADSLPQVWDELRRKVSQAAGELPPGSMPPYVNDDFGDVYGVFLALTGDGYSNHDLKEIVEDLRKELLLCEDVGRIDFWGVQDEVVYVEIDRAKLARLGLTNAAIFNTIDQQNTVTRAGEVKVGAEEIDLRVTGAFTSVKDMEELLVQGTPDGKIIRLKDVASIERGYRDPPTQVLRRNGKQAIGIGISTVSGGNVVVMGDAVNAKLEEIMGRVPVGIEIEPISFQADTVSEAVNGFMINLGEAVLIVILVLALFMGRREGFIIGIVLVLTILGTFICMKTMDISLQRVSLGALIIALGMLVDNAIVVTEGIVVKSVKGKTKIQAAEETVREVQWPLLGATVIAVLAFAAISLSKDVTGEFLGSLFQVIAISLGLSWVFAVTVTPYLCVVFLPDRADAGIQVQSNRFYQGYKRFLELCVGHRWTTVFTVTVALCLAIYGFGFVKHNFFPDSTRSQFLVDVWYPEGSHIDRTSDGLAEMQRYMRTLDGVTDVTSFVGGGALRFVLTYDPEMPNSAYGQLVVGVDDYERVQSLLPPIAGYLAERHPDAVASVDVFKLGPGGSSIEARVIGPDSMVLRQLADQVMEVMYSDSNAYTIRHDWGQRTKALEVRMAEARSREVGVTRPEIGNSLEMNFSGLVSGVYRDGDDLLPIMLRPPEAQRKGIDNLDDVQVWSSVTGNSIPIEQVTDGVETVYENPAIHRLNRMRTLTVMCKQRTGTAADLFARLRPLIEAIELPPGYKLEWGGEYETSNDANEKVLANVPVAFAFMLLITVLLFNSFRQPIIIFLCLPLAVVGVTAGLLLTDQPFGFMALLGLLSLSGMLIKNEIVLLDQVNIELKTGKPPYQALMDAAVSRVRPVCMAAVTTVLGMAPLLWDPFFEAMAVTIMAGLTFATVLTLVVVPVLYALFYRVGRDRVTKAAAEAERKGTGKAATV